MSKLQILPSGRLSSVTLHLDIQGEAWGGFTAEKSESRTYAPEFNPWPGLKAATADLSRWGDCRQDTVRPYYGQLVFTLSNEAGHYQHIVKELAL